MSSTAADSDGPTSITTMRNLNVAGTQKAKNFQYTLSDESK